MVGEKVRIDCINYFSILVVESNLLLTFKCEKYFSEWLLTLNIRSKVKIDKTFFLMSKK